MKRTLVRPELRAATERGPNGTFHFGIQKEEGGYRIVMRGGSDTGEWESAIMGGLHKTHDEAAARLGKELAGGKANTDVDFHDEKVQAGADAVRAEWDARDKVDAEQRAGDERAHLARQERRAKIDEDFGKAKFKATTVKVPLNSEKGEESKTLDVRGPAIGGLVVHRKIATTYNRDKVTRDPETGTVDFGAPEKGPVGKHYQVTHVASGKTVVGSFGSQRDAKLAAWRLSGETDWTKDEKEVVKDKSVGDKVKAMLRGHGYSGMGGGWAQDTSDPYAEWPEKGKKEAAAPVRAELVEAYDPAKHPRQPAGSERGGEFAASGTMDQPGLGQLRLGGKDRVYPEKSRAEKKKGHTVRATLRLIGRDINKALSLALWARGHIAPGVGVGEAEGVVPVVRAEIVETWSPAAGQTSLSASQTLKFWKLKPEAKARVESGEAWDEERHPRATAGDEHGGEFTVSGGQTGTTGDAPTQGGYRGNPNNPYPVRHTTNRWKPRRVDLPSPREVEPTEEERAGVKLGEQHPGKCFEMAGKYMMQMVPGSVLVHGTVSGTVLDPKLQPLKLAHAWVRVNGKVYDGTLGKFFDEDDYYAKANAVDDRTYDAKAAWKMMSGQRHYGPWYDPDAILGGGEPSRARKADATAKQQVAQAKADWLSGRAYVDNAGNYRLKGERGSAPDPTGGGSGWSGKGTIAPWNKAAKAAFKDASALHDAAHVAALLDRVAEFARPGTRRPKPFKDASALHDAAHGKVGSA